MGAIQGAFEGKVMVLVATLERGDCYLPPIPILIEKNSTQHMRIRERMIFLPPERPYGST